MKKLTARTKLCYGIGNLGYGTVAQTMNSFIMFFGTSILGISGSLVGLAIAISALWDGLSDPLIGYLSDKSKNNFFGKRLNFMFVATFGIAIFNILLWLIPSSLPMGIKFVWMLVSLLIIETFNTMFATPYVALGIDIAPDYNEQSSVQGYKTVFFILGMIMPSLLMIIFMPQKAGGQGQFNQTGYIHIALVTSILCLICGLISIFGTIKRAKACDYLPQPSKTKKQKNGLWKVVNEFFYALKSENYGPIILGYSVALISSAFLISVGMHLFTYSYHFNSVQIPIIMAILFLSAIVSQPVWIYLSNRLDKKPTLSIALTIILLGIGLTSVTFIFREFLTNPSLFFLVCPCIFICGFGTGALYSLPISMYADVITLDRLKSGENKSATYSGFMTLAFNIANSIALLIIGLLLDLIKFDSSQPVQAKSVQNALGFIVFIGCALSIALSMMLFSKYKVKRADVLKAQMRENKRQNVKNG